MDMAVIRLIFVLVVAVACWVLHPFGLSPNAAAAAGVAIGAAIVLFEMRLRAVSLKRLIGAAIGSILGIIGAYLFSLVIHNSIAPGSTMGLSELANSLMLSTATPCSCATLLRLKSLVTILAS